MRCLKEKWPGQIKPPLWYTPGRICALAAGLEDGWRGGEGGADGGLVKTLAGGGHSGGRSRALQQSSCSTHNCTTQGDKRGRVSRWTRTVQLPLSPFRALPPSPPPSADQPTCLSSAMWRSTSVLCSLEQQPPRCFRAAHKLWAHVSEKNTHFKHLRWCNMTNTRHGVCRRRKRKSSDGVGSELTLGMKKRNFTNKTSFCCCWLMLLPVKQTYHNWIVVIAHHILTATAPKAGRRSPPGQKTSLSLLLFEFLSSLLLPLMLYLHDGSRIDWIISILSEYANSSSK